jgi:hypothetical protein
MRGTRRNANLKKTSLASEVEKLLNRYLDQYNNTEIYSQPLIWQLLNKITKVLGGPFGKHEHQPGPKFEYKPEFYVCAFLFKIYFRLTYREAQEQIKSINGSSADFRSLSWAAVKKIPFEYIAKAIKMLAEIIRRILARIIKRKKRFIIGDSTGLSHCIKDGHKKIYDISGVRQKIKIGGHTKLYINVRYVILTKKQGISYKEDTVISVEPRYYKTKVPLQQEVCKGITWIESVSTGTAYTHDGILFRKAFDKKIFNKEKVLLDASFDNEKDVITFLYSSRCQPHIKLQNKPLRSNLRKWVQEQFSKELFKYRGVGEGRFGAIKTRARRIQSKNENAQRCEATALVFATQIRTLLRVAFAMGYSKTKVMRFFIFLNLRFYAFLRSDWLIYAYLVVFQGLNSILQGIIGQAQQF